MRRGKPSISMLPLRHRHEPIEPENSVNDALDLIEAHVRSVLDHGGELALRRRLARLLGDAGAARRMGGSST